MFQGMRSVRTTARVTAVAALAGMVAGPTGALGQTLVRERPIMGAWVRPPSTLGRLDVILGQMAQAGFTDLYLETFYHGLSSTDSQVFRPRFTFDYVDEAVPLAAQHGIRVHAWLETAYWDFGGLGSYLLDAHPEWKVIDYLGRTDLGDQPGQRFVNIGIPGVQQVLHDYCFELASEQPGLWGIQTDYHRLPLDNDSSDGNPGPYSYDPWTVGEFERLTGLEAPRVYSSSPGSAWQLFEDFQRERIALAGQAMFSGIQAADPGVQFSAAIFAAAPTDTGQIAKMQDWPRMTAGGYLPVVVPMAYGSSRSSIRNDLRLAKASANGAKVAAGLAVINISSRPSLVQQLDVLYGEALDSFILFEANALVDEPGMLAEAQAAIAGSAPFLTGDLDRDRDVDRADLDSYEQRFAAAWTGQRVRAFGELRDLDTTLDTWLDMDDLDEMRLQFRAFRFGTDGEVTMKDLDAVLAAFTPAGEAYPRHLLDLDGDLDVDCDDYRVARAMVTVELPIDLNPDLNADGRVDLLDILGFTTLFGAGDGRADLVPDGRIDLFDLLRFFDVFGEARCR